MSADVEKYLKLSNKLLQTPDTAKTMLTRWALKVRLAELHRKIEGAQK